MAVLGARFKAEEYNTEPQEFELLPNMIAKLEVDQGDVKADDDGKGTTLAVSYRVIEPEEYAGKRFFSWISLEHEEAEKQERGRRELASLCRAIGLAEVEDSDELLFRAFVAKVKKGEAGVGKRSGRPYKARNSISRFYYPDAEDAPDIGVITANDNHPPARQAANDNAPPAVQQQAGSATGKSRPWGKRAA